MTGKRKLSESEKDVVREQRRAELAKLHPGERFFIHVADETDDYGEPLVSVLPENDHPKGAHK
jgi:hypothetical protein